MKIINLTPHPVVLITKNGKTVFESEGSIRLDEKRTLDGSFNGVSIYKKKFGGTDLPAFRKGTVYIVSALIASAFPREDFMVPDEIVRDNDGNIIGCKSLCHFNP